MSEELQIQPFKRGVFFPAYKNQVFHRLNIEYLAALQALPAAALSGLLATGIRHNLQRSGLSEGILVSLQPQLQDTATELALQGTNFMQAKQRLQRRWLLDHQRSFPAYRADMSVDFASKKLVESLLSPTLLDAQQRLNLAEYMLKRALEVNADNHWAHFELGWLYGLMRERLPEATFHFASAARLASSCEPLLANLAQRHLADALYGLQEYAKAAEVMQGVLHDRPPASAVSGASGAEWHYEASRYLAACGEARAAAQQLAPLLTRSELYYVQAQAEPDFATASDVQQALRDLRQIRVQRIQHYVEARWKQRPIASMPLPDHIDAQRLFQQVNAQHARVMAYLPYTTLSLREQQIGEQIVVASQKRVLREVQLRSRHYERVAEQERQRWSWVNTTGGVLLHVSIILLLASLMFYMVRLVLSTFGIANLLDADAMVSKVLGGMFLTGSVGVVLLQFVPWGMKKLLRKQIELDNTLHVLRASA
ncbi:MAG: tetratricopeptide repeat protein [Thiothrix sp.]